jgi:transcriptional regulator of arginine metabolism
VTSKSERQQTILRLIEERHLSTQSELADALRGQGIDTVQTTVSRDVAQLGLVKVRNGNGKLVYALPGAADLRRIEELAIATRRWATGMTAAGQILVITTPNGLAAPLADAIDEAGLGDVAGTIAGENTIFVAARNGMTGSDLEEQFRHHLGQAT